MLLIPVLSLIILVAALSTFILSVAAYYHYRSRERKKSAARMRQPDFIQAELVTPPPFMPGQSTLYAKTGQTAGDYYKFNAPVQGNVLGRPGMGSDYAGGYERKVPVYRETVFIKPAPPHKEKRQPGHKFMRFTPTGFLEPLTDVPVSKKSAIGELRWR